VIVLVKHSWKCRLGTRNWEIIGLRPLIGGEGEPYPPRLKGPIRLWAQPIINSSNNIEWIDPTIIRPIILLTIHDHAAYNSNWKRTSQNNNECCL